MKVKPLKNGKFVLSHRGDNSRPMTRDEAVSEIVRWLEHDCRLKVIEIKMSFPHTFFSSDVEFPTVRRLNNEEGDKAFREWLLVAMSSKDDEAYFQAVQMKYDELFK